MQSDPHRRVDCVSPENHPVHHCGGVGGAVLGAGIMSAPIKSEYRGHAITYSENLDEWNCYDVNYSNVSMQKVKAKIDDFYLRLRKESAVACYEISSSSGPKKTESKIIEFVKTVEHRAWSTNAVTSIEHKVAVVAQRDGSLRAARREAEINTLMPSTPQALAAFTEAEILYKDVEKAEAAFKAAFAAIPRLTISDIAALKKIKEGEA